MIDYEFDKPINTVGELKKYIGKPLLFYYNNGKSKPQYAWIKQLTEIPYYNYDNDMGIKKYQHKDTTQCNIYEMDKSI